MTAGTAVIMWLGELVTDRGIGNGMSILIFTQVVGDLPGALWSVQKAQGPWIFAGVIVIGLVVVAARRLHRAGAAAHSGAVRPADGRPQDVRRLLDLHPAEGEPGRRHPRHLRLERCSTCRRWRVQFNQNTTPPDLGAWISQYFVGGDHPLYMAALLRPDHLLHLLLRRDHLQPPPRSRTT